MSGEDNAAVARRFFAEQDRLGGPLSEELCAEGYTFYLPGYPPMNRESHSELAKVFYAAFPDITQTINDAFATPDQAAVRFTITGTHRGELMGVPPTGNAISVEGIATLRIVDGKVEELHEVFDLLGLMQQIGAIPSAEPDEA